MQYKWRALIAVSFGTYMGTMDFSIINVALPTLAEEFDRAPDTVVWVSLIASLVATGLTMVAGRGGDLFGRKRLYLAGWVVFGSGLILASLASTIEMLLGFRALQAVGIALVSANGNAIVTEAFPDNERGRALGIVGSVVGAGLMTGPIVGGILLGFGDWRALFWLRVPIVLIAMVLAVTMIQEKRGDHAVRKLDIPGSVMLFAFLSLLLLAVNRGQAWGWTSPTIISLLAAGLISFAAFIRIELGSDSPVLSLALFRVRSFSVAVASLVISFLGQSATLFLVPFYLVQVRGYSTVQMGLILATVPSMMLLLSSFSGQVADRYGFRYQTTLGIAIVAVGMLAMSTLDADTTAPWIMARLSLMGIGSAIFMSPNSSEVMGSVPRSMLGTASASLATGRNIGTAVGLAIAGAVLVMVASDSAAAGDVVSARDLPPEALLEGIRAAFLVAFGFSFTAVLVSLLRPASIVAQAREAGAAATSAPASDGD
jgi:EmrB/QacA subfamily drug resistance transporter